MSAKTTLQEWIADAITDPEKPGPCTHIALMHDSGGNDPSEVYTCRFGGPSESSPNRLASVFTGKARTYSQDLPGVQTFWLYAFYAGPGEENENPQPRLRHPFVVNGTYDYGGLGNEAPDARGRTQQDMRHVEAMMQMAINAIHESHRSVLRSAEVTARGAQTLAEENRSLREENTDAREVVLQMMHEKQAQEQSNAMDQLKYLRETEERSRWMKLIAPLANSLFGNVFPKETEDTALIESALENLDENQVKMLVSALPKEVGGLIMARFSRSMTERREQIEAKAKVEASVRELPIKPEYAKKLGPGGA
jgi:hypothetical protein